MKSLLFVLAFGFGFSAFADATFDSAQQFHELFNQALPAAVQKDPAARLLHFVPDENVQKAAQAGSIDEAMSLIKDTSIDTLWASTSKLPAARDWNDQAKAALKKTPLTMVIVPGIFGEFIRVRPFEDIFAAKSKYRDQYEKLVDAAPKALAFDPSYSSNTLKNEDVSLKTLVQVGSIDDENGDPLVKVAFLYPAYASLETLGDVTERATMLNERIRKYLEITGEQNLVFVGYSRGTTFALEMLSQAKQSNAPWLKNVKGLIGLSGVVWGSTSADQTADPNEPMYQTVKDTKALADTLRPITSNMRVTEKFKAGNHNAAAVTSYIAHMAFNNAKVPSLEQGLKDFTTPNPLLSAALHIDFVSSTVFLFKALGEVLPKRLDLSMAGRAKNLISAALLGADQLRTEQRVNWWKTATLPDSVNYYALTAIMPNPEDSALSQVASNSDVAFAKGSFEDQFLLKGRNDYLKASGVKANDSQVAIAQAMFLPNAIHAVNPQLPPLKTQFLGTIGTHHWGAALKIVFDMKGGVTNPFPRNALLKALAEKVALDQQSAKQ